MNKYKYYSKDQLTFKLMDSIADLTVEEAEELLKAGADVNKHTSQGNTPLMWAAVATETEFVKLFLRYGANVDYQEYCGYSVLMKAIDSSSHNLELIQALLDAKPDLSLRDGMAGQTALERARDYWGNRPEVVDLILKHQCSLENEELEKTIESKKLGKRYVDSQTGVIYYRPDKDADDTDDLRDGLKF